MPASSLDPFRDPSSVAVVGASDDPAKWGYWVARGALAGGHRREVFLVNSLARPVQGRRAYAAVAELPSVPELVVLCVPARFVLEVVVEALGAGTKAFLGITAGVADEDELARLVTQAGARIVGPNSLGLYDASSQLQLAWGNFTPGSLAVVSQSGQLGSEIANLAARAGLGISRFISIGNQIDVNAAELLDDLIDHGATTLIALYLESFADGAHLVKTLRTLAEAGKRTIVLTTGASAGSRRLAKSHTGSLTSALDIVDAGCRASGAVRVATPTELVHLARYLSIAPAPRGRRVAVVSDSGGQGGIAADVAATVGLTTPVFSEELQRNLAGILPMGASVSNPVDLAGAGEADIHTYAELSERLLGSGEVDAVVLSGYFGCYGEDTPSLEARELDVVDRLGRLVETTHAPLLVHSMSATSPAVARMWEHNIAAFDGIEFVMNALGHAAHFARWPGRDLRVPTVEVRSVEPGYWAARQLLAHHGVDTPRAMIVASREDLAVASKCLTMPLVLKAGWLNHKSENGGVKLGLDRLDSLIVAYRDMVARLGEGQYVLEEQDCRSNVVEILIGGRRDRDFGPVVAVGAGGVETELLRDVCLEIAPVDHACAMTMIERLRCLPLLLGWRGKPAVDISSLASMIVAVSEVVAANPQINDFEVNPVRVAPEGALAVDALITMVNQGEETWPREPSSTGR